MKSTNVKQTPPDSYEAYIKGLTSVMQPDYVESVRDTGTWNMTEALNTEKCFQDIYGDLAQAEWSEDLNSKIDTVTVVDAKLRRLAQVDEADDVKAQAIVQAIVDAIVALKAKDKLLTKRVLDCVHSAHQTRRMPDKWEKTLAEALSASFQAPDTV